MSNPVLFVEFAAQWIEEVATLRLRKTGLSEYRSLLERHLIPRFGDMPIREVDAADIQRYMFEKADQGYSPRSVRNHLAVMRALLKTATAMGVVDVNEAMRVSAPRQERRERPFPTPAEMKAIIEAASSWRLLVALPIYAAARRGECLALRWPQVSIERRQVAFLRSMRAGIECEVKNSASRASVTMAEELVPLFEERRLHVPDPIDGYVFCHRDGSPLSDARMGRVLSAACSKAGVCPYTPHELRHGSIAAMIASGAHPKVVQEFARHASIQTTMDVYGHLLAPAGGDAVVNMGRLISGS